MCACCAVCAVCMVCVVCAVCAVCAYEHMHAIPYFAIVGKKCACLNVYKKNKALMDKELTAQAPSNVNVKQRTGENEKKGFETCACCVALLRCTNVRGRAP